MSDFLPMPLSHYIHEDELKALFGPFVYPTASTQDALYQILFMACQYQKNDILHTMLDRGLPVDTWYDNPRHPQEPLRDLAQLCVRLNNAEILQRILPQLDLTKYPHTPLLNLCAEHQQLELFQMVLDAGANPFLEDNQGKHALQSAFVNANSADYLKAILSSIQFKQNLSKIHEPIYGKNIAKEPYFLTPIQAFFIKELSHQSPPDSVFLILNTFNSKEHLLRFKEEISLNTIEKKFKTMGAQLSHFPLAVPRQREIIEQIEVLLAKDWLNHTISLKTSANLERAHPTKI